jgi:hypothetical protein
MEANRDNVSEWDCLKLANAASGAEFRFWHEVVREHDAGRLGIDQVRKLVLVAETWRREAPPSRATAYRLIERWRSIVVEMGNPGHGT